MVPKFRRGLVHPTAALAVVPIAALAGPPVWVWSHLDEVATAALANGAVPANPTWATVVGGVFAVVRAVVAFLVFPTLLSSRHDGSQLAAVAAPRNIRFHFANLLEERIGEPRGPDVRENETRPGGLASPVAGPTLMTRRDVPWRTVRSSRLNECVTTAETRPASCTNTSSAPAPNSPPCSTARCTLSSTVGARSVVSCRSTVAIHPTAVISPAAELGSDVVIGPYVIVEGNATIGDRTVVMAHSFVGRDTEIGPDCEIHMSTVVGHAAQIRDARGPDGRLTIGPRNIIREHVTIHRAREPNHQTLLGADNYVERRPARGRGRARRPGVLVGQPQGAPAFGGGHAQHGRWGRAGNLEGRTAVHARCGGQRSVGNQRGGIAARRYAPTDQTDDSPRLWDSLPVRPERASCPRTAARAG